MNVVHRVARNERAILLVGAIAIAGVAWIEVLRRAGSMDAMIAGHVMPFRLTSSFVMWATMMVAMMLPSALPALLVFHAAQKRSLRPGVLLRRSAIFACGYLVVWTGWSLAAALAQGLIRSLALLGMDLAVATPFLGAPILLVAGLYQFTPWKRSCLEHCRSPQDFLVLNWRNGRWGALVLGTRHGLFCVGCCWALMLVLFVVGIMNVAWVALLAGVVLVEKAVARGPWPSRVVGALLVAWAGWLAYVGFSL